MNIKDLFRRKKKPDINKEKLMQYFSEEYLEKLINEHKLVQASINRIQQRAQLYRRENQISILDQALVNFRVRKVELEVQIDELREFLNG
jgi:hypothetical protein